MHPHRPIVFTYKRDKRIEQSYLYNQVIYPINFVSCYVPYLVEVHRTAILLHFRLSDASHREARLYVSYSTSFTLDLILSMQIPFVSFQSVRTSEHMSAAGVFAVAVFPRGCVVFYQGTDRRARVHLVFR